MTQYVELEDVKCIVETDAALLCLIDGDEVWVPISVVNFADSEVVEEGDSGLLVVKEWWAYEKGVL